MFKTKNECRFGALALTGVLAGVSLPPIAVLAVVGREVRTPVVGDSWRVKSIEPIRVTTELNLGKFGIQRLNPRDMLCVKLDGASCDVRWTPLFGQV